MNMWKRWGLMGALMMGCNALMAQSISYTCEDQWQVYDKFNNALLDNQKHIYKGDTRQPGAYHRGNGWRDKHDASGCAAAIWCQATYYDMVIEACQRAEREGNKTLKRKYKRLHDQMYKGMKRHYTGFDFDDNNTNTGWFVYDDIMWWTCALAHACEDLKGMLPRSMAREMRDYSERSFLRTWYGSPAVGDDGSYADPQRGLGGGMFWEWQPIENPKPHVRGDFRSACINFPTVIAACRLHRCVPEGRQEPTSAHPTRQTKAWYLARAKEVYEWADGTLVHEGRVADGIHGGGPEFHDHLYNQATYIGASCLLYQITGDTRYRDKAVQGANYVFHTMSKDSVLPYEGGIEQGVYAAIFAQYIAMLVQDCNLPSAQAEQYRSFIERNLQEGFTHMDHSRGLHNGKFGTTTRPDEVVESYGGSALPALMLMFPASK